MFAPLLPSDGDEVAQFLADVAQALGMREAELASLLGVSRSTLSGWKARGSIPANYSRWFTEEFCYVLFSQGFRVQRGEDLRHVGIRVALRVLRTTDFNPFGIDQLAPEDRFDLSFWHFQGMCQLSHFVMKRLPLTEATNAERDATASDVVIGIMRALRGRLISSFAVSQ